MKDEVKAGDYFLLPGNSNTLSLNRFEADQVREYRVFDLPEKVLWATDQKQWVAIIDIAKRMLSIYPINDSNAITLPLPSRLEPKSILVYQNSVFIGGTLGIAVVAQYHIDTNRWYALEMPRQLLSHRKAIDDLVIQDQFLIAVDNLVYPKYILYYTLNSSDERPPLSHFRKLLTNGTYESIVQARISGDYLGLRSRTVGGTRGHYQHIAVYQNPDMTQSFAISLRTGLAGKADGYNDFLFIGDQLLIARENEGLGVFRINTGHFHPNPEKKLYNTQYDDSVVSYKAYRNESIVKLTPVPGTLKTILTIKNERQTIRHELVEI